MTTLACLRAQLAELGRRMPKPVGRPVEAMTTGELRHALAQLLIRAGISPTVFETAERREAFTSLVRERLGRIDPTLKIP